MRHRSADRCSAGTVKIHVGRILAKLGLRDRIQAVVLAYESGLIKVLDFAGPYEVFNVAGELGDGAPFSVFSVGLSAAPVIGRGGFTVLPGYSLDDAPASDILIIPGGAGTRPLVHDEQLLAWLRARAGEVELLMSVRTGALLLAAAGLLDGLPATTHHDAYEELRRLSPTTEVVRGQRFVRGSSSILTAGGVSAGVDAALAVVDLFAGADTRAATVAEMEWMWHA